jgi:hypothetical protein
VPRKSGSCKARLVKTFTTKSCPTCSSPITKVSGCKHVTCLLCSSHFCWICKGSIVEFAAPESRGRMCVCNRIHAACFYTAMTGAAVVGLPIAGAVALVALPPAAIWYASASQGRLRSGPTPRLDIGSPLPQTILTPASSLPGCTCSAPPTRRAPGPCQEEAEKCVHVAVSLRTSAGHLWSLRSCSARLSLLFS